MAICMEPKELRNEKVAVIGAGLVGCLTAISLARLGYTVTVYEYRADPRIEDLERDAKNLRSINLAVSARGINALNYVHIEMAVRVLRNIIPMRGRMIHDISGNQSTVRYGLNNEAINSIDRGALNIELLNELEKYVNIKLNFNYKLTKLDFKGHNENPRVFFDRVTLLNGKASSGGSKIDYDNHNSNSQNPNEPYVDYNLKNKAFEYKCVFGADGSYSTTRFQLQKYIRMDYYQEYMDCCYVELYIPPTKSSKFKFKIHPNRLHIWPRKDFMLIALPNHDGSFTSTFFGPWSLVEKLETEDKVEQFFRENFRDAIDLIGVQELRANFVKNPKCSLVCNSCHPYNYKGKCILVGDAAHSMVPFYGQGMNCGFEDVRILTELIEKYNFNLELAFNHYSSTRKKDLEAILYLAKANYTEMSSAVTEFRFKLHKLADNFLNKVFGDRWIPLYTMVSFRSDISYSQCLKRSRAQNKILTFTEFSCYFVCGYYGLKFLKNILKE